MRSLPELARLWDALACVPDRGIHVFEEGSGALRFQSYAELAESAGAMAAALSRRGIRRGDAVLVSAETSPLFASLWLGLMWLGATPVPLPPRHALAGQANFEARLERILPHFRHYLHGAGEAPAVQAAAANCRAAVRLQTLSSVEEDARAASGEAAGPAALLAPEDIAFIQYTSGSTKAPKGIRVSYANLRANVGAIQRRLCIDPEADTLISWLPLYHDMGLIGKFLLSILTQTPLVLIPPHVFVRRPVRLLNLIEEHRATLCSMPNFAYELILKRLPPDTEGPDLGSMKWFGVGAEPVRLETVSEFERRLAPHGLRPGVVSPCYGLAEATLGVSIEPVFQGYRVQRLAGGEHVTCGLLLEDFEARIAPDSGALQIRGPSVAETALIDGEVVRLVDEEGFYDTRDIAVIADGRLVILGRTDEMFVVNGENRFPYDIEAVVRGVCGESTRVACIHVPAGNADPRGELVVLYERRPPQAVEDARRDEAIREAVLSHCGLRLDAVVPLETKSLPLTPSGKMQRVLVRQMYLRARELRAAAQSAPISPLPSR